MSKTEHVYQCHGCRQKKVIVARKFRMNYCADCKHKMPTKFQFESYVHENSGRMWSPDFNKRGRPEGSGKEELRRLPEELDTELYE